MQFQPNGVIRLQAFPTTFERSKHFPIVENWIFSLD